MEGAVVAVPCPQAVADGAMTNMTHCFIATGVEKVSEQHFDEHECLTVHLLDRDEVFRLMKDGGIFQSLMLAPLWRYFCECKL